MLITTTETGRGGRVTARDIESAASDLGVRLSGAAIVPGSMYLAGRNTGVHLLTCRAVNLDLRCVYPTGTAYAYDLHECYAVVEMEEHGSISTADRERS